MKIGKLMKITSGKNHAWYETDLGYQIRKPLGVIRRPFAEIERIPLPQEIEAAKPWWRRIIEFFRGLWR